MVFDTIQAYLRDAHQTLMESMARAQRERFYYAGQRRRRRRTCPNARSRRTRCAAKVVRGAYMVAERARAKEHGYPDPINPDIQARPLGVVRVR